MITKKHHFWGGGEPIGQGSRGLVSGRLVTAVATRHCGWSRLPREGSDWPGQC